ncbi:MAG: undecaprenyl-diphosphate phosphatase [Christensenellales bacterium]
MQGLTEFLPVSSSGHLVLYARLTGAESNVGFDVAVHLATLIAVIICFRKETIGIVRRPFSAKSRLLWLATLCTAASVLATKDLALEVFENPALLPVFFMITAVLLTVASLFPRKTEHDMTYLDAAIIGIAQGFATFPGLSRSGTTVSTGTLLGVKKRKRCVLFPLVGSDYYRFGGGRTDFAVVRARCPPVIVVGFVCALTSGIAALKFVKTLLGKVGGTPFAVYLAVLSVLLTLNDCFSVGSDQRR